MIEQPMYLGAVLVLPLAVVFVGPLFCGWLCPAGGITEYLSRLVPSRFQLDLAGKMNATPIRYGFTVGMMGASFLGASVCPTWAISSKSESRISLHACNVCMDCVKVCNQNAIAYRPN